VILKKTNYKHRKYYGFTLIELLITISLIGILAAFFIPRYNDFNRRQELKTIAEELTSFVEKAQNKALSGVQGASDPVIAYGVFYFTSAHSAGIYRQLDLGASEEWDSTAIAQLSFATVIKIAWPAENPIFNVPTGKLSGNDRIITVCYDNIGKYEIAVKTTGIVKMSERQDVAACP